MSDPVPQPSVLDDETAEFIQHHVSINVASRDDENRPAVARAAGCRIGPNRNQLTIYLASQHNQTLLDNLRANHCLAVVFSRPSTHRTIQFKGNDAQVIPVSPDDQVQISVYQESFARELRSIGFPPVFCQAILPPADAHFVGICFTPERAYSQTPGPNAGRKL